MGLSMAGLFIFFGYFATQLHLEEDINKLMPSSKNPDGTTKLAFADLRIKDKTFVLFEGRNGATPEDIAGVCDDFIDSLLASDRDSVVGNVFYRLEEDLLPDAAGYFTEHLPAYIDTACYRQIDSMLTIPHFEQQMEQNREDLTSPMGDLVPELLQTDPIGMRNLLLKGLAQGTTGNYQTVEGHFFVPDTTVCVAFITPRYSSTNTGQGSAMFVELNRLIEKFEAQAPDIVISYHGTPANGYYNSTIVKNDLTTTITGSLILVMLFIMLCFRRWTTIPLLLLPVAFGTLTGMAAMYFIKGQFSLLALGIGGIVLGVALSYVLHVLTHHQYAENPEQLLREQTEPLLLGCVTTIGSFGGLFFTNTDLLQDFGLFATIAIAATTLFSLIYLPHLMGKKPQAGYNRAFALIDRLNAYPFDRQKWLIGTLMAIVAACVAVYVVKGTQFDGDMHNLGYEAERVTYSEDLLRAKTYTGDKTQYFASQGKTMEEAIANFSELRQKLDSLKAIGLVKSYTPTDQLLVSLDCQKQRIKAWQDFWTEERIDKVRQLIAATAPKAGLNAEAYAPFFEAARADYEADALYESGIVPEGFLSTLTEQSYGGDYLCFTSVRCTNDSVRSKDSDYTRICDAVCSSPRLMVLDTYYYTTDTLEQLGKDFDVLQWLSMGFVLIVLLLSFHFNLSYTLIGFAPIVLSWLTVLGVMALFGVQFNLINIIISTFIFGIGVDYSIFVMNGLISAQDEHLLRQHKTAIFFSVVVLVATVGSMLLAVHPAIRSVGFATLVGLLAAVVLSYVLQPAAYRIVKAIHDKRKA